MPITGVNLCIRPALKVAGGPGWNIPTGWGRSTSMHASLPRTTGLAGTAPGPVHCAIAPVIPGKPYVGSVHIRSIGANTGSVSAGWYDEREELISTSTAVPFTHSAGTTARLSTGGVTAPAGAAYMRVHVNDLDGSTNLTGCMVHPGTVLLPYNDGDDASWYYTGPDGASVSATGVTALTATAEYDEALGRVRINAAGAFPGADTLVVTRRLLTEAQAAAVRVRGPALRVAGGIPSRPADDYEFPASVALSYRIAVVPGGGHAFSQSAQGLVPIAPIETVDLVFTPPTVRAWLKFMAAPQLNRKITLTDWTAVDRPDRNVVYEVKGRTDPIVVTAGHGSRRTTVTLRTFTQDETERLDLSLRQGMPGMLHLPPEVNLPTMYVVFGKYSWARPSKRSQGAIFTIPLIEVSPPPSSIFAAGITWADVVEQYDTWADVMAAHPSWQHLVAS